ncbi:LytR/AlgR family response regulator transcription factor [Pedobacter agri]|uniref:LytR/AlgR family response regulator transcription factor n=1 Tax=Pedobacter agri TaxID=454586 RepID=UPI00292D01BA|nr:response regulator transcription factor [Pedobacter agri]
MISVIIVEDSRLARLELNLLIQAHPQIQVLGEADTVKRAVELIDALTPDLVFLDIHLPGGNGFDVLSKLKKVPVVIFTTAFADYALESFEHNTIDYLLKPITPDKLNRAIQKTEVLLGKNNPVSFERKLDLGGKIFIKDRKANWVVPIEEVSMFESMGNYTKVYFNGNRPLFHKSLQQVFESVKEGLFIRANRRQVVNVQSGREIIKHSDGKLILKLSSGEEVSVSRRQMNSIRSAY